MPRARFAGTNGWYDTADGLTVCALLEYPEFNVVLDAGGGFAAIDDLLDFEKPTYLFLSHLHVDHIAGLHALPKYRFAHDLTILIAAGSHAALRAFLDPPYTAPAGEFKRYLGYALRLVTFPAAPGDLPFALTTLPVVHPVETHAARIEADGRVVAYVTDTGFCANAISIAERADLLIAECSYRSGETSSDWPHLNPEEGGRIAVESGARRLVLTHFDARRYSAPGERGRSEAAARVAVGASTRTGGESPQVIAAHDGLVVDF